MMVPEAWEKHKSMDPAKKAFYQYNACIMEPWDGPASIPFTDGKFIGALLDRNGLRPSRYTVTKDGYVVMSSEVGVLDIDPANVEKHSDKWSDRKCQKKEAFAFTQKNSAMEPMKAEELFKAGCAMGTKKYIDIKEVLVDCELDILQINQGKPKLGGYVEFEKLVTKSPFSEGVTKPSNDFVIEASKMIQSAWKDQEVSGFMLSGLSHYLHVSKNSQ